MKTPPKKSAKDLVHPKGTVKAWNGDTRSQRSSRWNGAPDHDDKGFASRRADRGLTITDGTTPHETKVWNSQAKDTVNLQGTPVHKNSGAIQPRPAGNTFDPSFRPADHLPTNNSPSVRSIVNRKVTINES